MSVSWKECEGQVVNNTFPLLKYLGGSPDSAVFLTEISGSQPARAAIKLIPEGPASGLQLSLWRRAAQLSHPNLLRVLDSGRCRLADADLLYVTMEFAEEDLSQILPERALTAAEARDVLEPALAALNYLHYHGLVHSHLKPSNILATGDQLKLSSDTLFPVGESRKASANSDIHSAPETGATPFAPTADAWSLGVTLVETLTQRAPEWQASQGGDPVVPEAVPQPFLDIARHTLRRDPKLRWNLAEIGACLNPVAVAAAAAAASPLSVPLSSVPAVPAAKLQGERPSAPPARLPATEGKSVTAAKQTLLLPNYALPVAAAMIVLLGILALPKILGRRAETASAPAENVPASAPVQQAQATPVSNSEKPLAAKPPARPVAEAKEKTLRDSTLSSQPAKPAATAEPASLRSETPTPVEARKASVANPSRGEVLDQVLPQVSEKAQATISGTVRVTVLLHVDAAGNVSDATLDSPGPSPYFANLALAAARRWEFTSPEADGHSVSSEWRVRFEFKQSGVKAFPTQTTP